MNENAAIDILRTRSLASVLEREIEKRILSGEIQAGGRINENQLAAEFGTSRGPIRFDRSGDVKARFHVFPAAADQAP